MSAPAGFADLTAALAGQYRWLDHSAAVDAVRAAIAQGVPVCEALSAAPAHGMRFVDHTALPDGEAYECFIARTASIPSRHNLHDLFNGLVWLALPQAKRRLNDLQAGEIARRGIGPTRGPLRDALTLFDENGAVLQAPPAVWAALQARDWRTLFIEQRALWDEARLLIFGHALMEKLLAGRKDATAHVLLAPGTDPSLAPDDAAIAAALQPEHLAQKPFTPLPVLGVPGWWAANADICFYDDPQVFRPRRVLDQRQQQSPGANAELLEVGRLAPNCSAFPPTEKSS